MMSLEFQKGGDLFPEGPEHQKERLRGPQERVLRAQGVGRGKRPAKGDKIKGAGPRRCGRGSENEGPSGVVYSCGIFLNDI